MRACLFGIVMMVIGSTAFADPLACNMDQYRAGAGPSAAVAGDVLTLAWPGEGSSEMRAQFAIEGATPIVRELAVRSGGGQWAVLGRNLSPEFHVTSGVRRVSYQQLNPLRDLGVDITDPEVIEREKWFAFWDAPLVVPGVEEGRNPRNVGLPRSPDEIRRADATFNASSCAVKTDGARVEVTFPGLSMGIFAGELRFTAYRGTNLLRMEAIASTNEPSVAYKYRAGLSGFSSDLTPRLAWHDTGGRPQEYQIGGPVNDDITPVRAANRLLVAEGSGASLATFPAPTVFFFTREVDTNLGYTWYRKDSDTEFAFGIRQGDGEEDERYLQNFALYNAPPGTEQRMAVYFYASPDMAEGTREAALAFTHHDRFRPVAGYKTFVNHFHLRFTERLRAAGSLDREFQDLNAMRALGLDIIGLSDFHGDLRGNDTGVGRFEDQRDYGIASAKASDKGFLVVPWEEPSAYFGGHYNVMWPRDVFWTRRREPDQPFSKVLPEFGKVYHAGSAEDVQQLLDTENGYWFHSHPRTKGTTGYPDAIFDKPYVRNDRYLGIAFKTGMGQDLSEERLCEYRCFDAIDTMNNMFADTGLKPKYLIADIDTYQKNPEDDLYPGFQINYVKLDELPEATGDWTPILDALRNGDFFVTTGEIVIPHFEVTGSGSQRTVVADVEWTFPLEFVEVVWGDGTTVDRKVVRGTDLPPFSSNRFNIPFDATGKKWVRFSVWDSAGNGAFVQPIWLNP